MSLSIRNAFSSAKADSRPVFVAYVTAGFPSPADTVDVLLSLQKGGADIIELGVPFSDPIADGPTIQDSTSIALNHGIDIPQCLDFVKQARAKGLHVPVLFMGYYNPFLIYGEQRLMEDCAAIGVNGFIVVDLPPEEAVRFRNQCSKNGLSYVPLIAPSTTDSRMKHLASVADSFIYVVSTLGVTGARASVNTELPELVKKIKTFTAIPLAVGFGVSTREHFVEVGRHAEGVVIGSKIITTLKDADPSKRSETVYEFAKSITHRDVSVTSGPAAPQASQIDDTAEATIKMTHTLHPRFGEFGGQYAPEALVDCLEEIETAFVKAKNDPGFWEEFRSHYPYIGRPSPLHLAERLTKKAGGARIWLKREDLNHTGSHKINKRVGSKFLLAMRLGKKRIIAGDWCIVYMGAEDFQSVMEGEARAQMLEKTFKLPDVVMALPGDGIETGKHSATLSAGTPGVLHGTRTYLLQDKNGQIIETHSISAGLDYPGVGPEHAWLKDSGRAEYIAATDAEAMKGIRLLSETEGIIPALETAHAVWKAYEIAQTLKAEQNIVVCISGRGDKDVVSIAEALPKLGEQIEWDLRFEGELKGRGQ
ncbi:tryptophan synthase alpha chain-domain-containing protein [Chytridium lagenaria]|nr:tryptophan synthase alpha chain-domain-containing protein [Chytridium lagenaria]